jgi:Peptidyl-prolyl cis-trans isomerase (rotamase) - cyclophilin family
MTLHTHLATLHTNHGDIRLGLFENHAPKTVKNFVGLATGEISWTHPNTGETVSDPLYTDVIFHRVIPGFMIQGGDPLGTGTGGPGYQFDDEIHPELSFNEPFLLAMANAGKRGGQGTNGSQCDDRRHTLAAGQPHHFRCGARRGVPGGSESD